ncbi:MAG: type II secretion system ATPase GspE [Planctomycetota bacterium]
MLTKQKLIDLLVEDHKLTPEIAQECLSVSATTGTSMLAVIRDRGYLDENALLTSLSRILGIPYSPSLADKSVPEEFVQAVPVGFARSHSLVGIARENGTFQVATSDPLSVHPMDDLALFLKANVRPILAKRDEIIALINAAYEKKSNLVSETLDELGEEELEGLEDINESRDLLDIANKAPIIKLVNMILFQALKMRASDIHIQPFETRLQIRYRIDGILYDIMTPPKRIQEAIISRVKVMGKMDIAERRLPQDGRATIRIADRDVDIRISSIPTSFGERIVMRLLDKGSKLYQLEELGIAGDHLKKLGKLIRYSYGILLVTGPTGSGKTTTLYGALSRLNSTEKNILTIEDPIEYQLPGVSQMEVSTKKGMTFATGLRHVVRQDPDIIMVGEIRDLETAHIAIQSSLTGHLVFSTLHTNDSASAVTRLLDLGIEPYLVSSSVIAVLAQRLVRCICPDCRTPYTPDDDEIHQVGLERKLLKDGKLFKGAGCPSCLGKGYYGRSGIYELLVVDDIIREQVMNRAGASTIKTSALGRGLTTLKMDGAQKVLSGTTTVEEILRVTQLDLY